MPNETALQNQPKRLQNKGLRDYHQSRRAAKAAKKLLSALRAQASPAIEIKF